jgi:hypothetical protein
MGNVHRYTVQCVLVINMFNEKIFLFLWFWFVCLFLASLVNFAYWLFLLVRCLNRTDHVIALFFSCQTCGNQRRFIKSHLKRRRGRDAGLLSESKSLDQFVQHYLHPDGIFLLRLLDKRAGGLITSFVVDALYSEFEQNR